VKPSVISLFAGCGGSSLGYHQAGFRELLALDFWELCRDSFRVNFPEVPFLVKSICETTAEEVFGLAGIRPGELDILDGSPPCQGFSTAGNRDVYDERNDLYTHYIRLATSLRPRVLVMENVTGMAKGKMKGLFLQAMTAFKTAGYTVEARVLNSAKYGAPQDRQRVIFQAVLHGSPVWPTPSTDPPLTVSEALASVPPGEKRFINPTTKEYRVWNAVEPGGKGSDRRPQKFVSFYTWWKLNPRRVCPTIMTKAEVWHWAEPRLLTIPEVKRLMGFPDDFFVAGTYDDQYHQLGNAVPPPMMKAIASTILEKLLSSPSQEAHPALPPAPPEKTPWRVNGGACEVS
jgi:DNA (cytosine-5)-methyltransferase 1